ncbi:MAG: CCA tRNA nucleotidyltransferase [Flavobacteriaceae bacterium]|nr:CCA tRNA nucleotidyltransferase [Flavobacteriaceae bacterium]
MSFNSDFSVPLSSDVFQQVKAAAAELSLETYVVGGFVRDHLLGRKKEKADIDFVTLGSGIALAKAVQKRLPSSTKISIFKTYGTAMLKFEGMDLEFVGARKESYAKESRNPEVEEGNLQDDQNRRDFTINAMAVSLNEVNYGDLIDPFNGLEDLKNKLIRTPLDPVITYSDDPLRMLRAIRFSTQLNFMIDEASQNAIAKESHRMEIITKERIVEELHKIMLTEVPSKGFLLLDKLGLLNDILPELTALKGIDEVEGQTHKDNFYHTFEVVDNICKTTDNLWLRWAALLHDIGKAPTKKFNKQVGWTFHAHEFVGAKMVYTLFKRLKMPLNEKMKYVQKMVFMSSRPIVLAQDGVTDSAVRRLVFDAGDYVDDLLTLCEADITTKNPKRFERYHNNFKLVREKIVEVEERDHIRNFQPPVSGELIMETFDLKPCREIGIIKEKIKEAILEGIIPNEFEAAFALMKDEGKALGLTEK